ncbi:MAG: PilX N-terminal domain-containing pilus assembly protein [Methylobacter sp.]|nr:PilX N-terminal domain-containing pilus assembly protein [Candidatus Methylobacter titanis]
MIILNLKLKSRQQGAVTLLVVLVLAMVMAVVSLSTTRTGVMEQKITGNDIQAKGVFEGADAGVEYGQAYLTNDSSYSHYKALTWTTVDSNQSSSPNTASGAIASGNFSYTPAVTYQRVVNSDYIRITSTASAVGDNTVAATSEQYVKSLSLLNGGSAFNAPPLVLDGCLANVVGGPDIYVGTRTDGIAVATSISPANQGAWGDGSDADNVCLKQGHLNAHSGQPTGSAFTPGQAWEYIFGTTTRAQIQAKAAAEVAAGVGDSARNYVWVTDSGNYHDSWGSATHPVILVFAAEAACPKINGGPTIYGVVFVDASCTGANGWGGVTVYGSVTVNGGMSKLNANTTIHDWSAATGTTTSLGNSFIDGIYEIPGTWKDF